MTKPFEIRFSLVGLVLAVLIVSGSIVFWKYYDKQQDIGQLNKQFDNYIQHADSIIKAQENAISRCQQLVRRNNVIIDSLNYRISYLEGHIRAISLSAPEYTTEDIYKLLKAYLPVNGDSIQDY